MSRRRSAPSLPRVEQDAHDVLAGRAQVSAGQLLALIHAINPTGRSLGAAEERRRYELKARLQSLLIRRFPDDIAVSADAPGVVAIRHRYEKLDACHARLHELDEDARARLQWLLDIGDATEAPTARSAPRATAHPIAGDGALALGRAALAEFDYEAARRHFENAALGASGDPAAARELLELLVDHMVLDADALALEHRLPPGSTEDADVRGLLAVAAARTGDEVAVRRLVDGLAGPRAAEAWAALAEAAIGQQACDRLEDDIARLAAIDPAHPGLVGFREAAQRLRADARRPAEQELLRLTETGGDDAVAAAARALLARWPDSAVAGRILGRIHEARRDRQARGLLARAHEALSAGDTGLATELCRQARTAGADTAELSEQIRRAEAARAHARDDAEVASVLDQLGAADPRPGLAGFLALRTDLRRRVRDQLDLPILGWLEHAAAHQRGTRYDAAIAAALAVAAAGQAIERGDPDGALAILEPHGAATADLPRANELRTEARRQIATRRRAAAADALAQAQRALAAGDLERCERLCSDADPRELDEALRPQLTGLRQELRARRELARGLDRVAALTASGELVSARYELERMLAADLAAADRAAVLRAQLDEIRAELRRAWWVHSDRTASADDPHDRIGELLGWLPYVESTFTWLVSSGRELVIASMDGRHVFLGRVAVDDGRVVERHHLRAPQPLGNPTFIAVDGDTLWLIDETGRVLGVSWTTGEPVRWGSLAAFLTGPERIERVFRLPGGSHLWLEVSVPGEPPLDRVIEIEPWRLRREISEARSLHPLVAGSASCVIGGGLYGGAVRYTERGSVAEEIAACAGLRVSAVTVDPDHELIVLGSWSADDDDYNEIEILRLRAGRAVHRLTVPDSDRDLVHRCAAARAQRLIFLLYLVDRGVARLAALQCADPTIEPLWTVGAPSDLVLVQDADAVHVVALRDSPGGVAISRLGAQPPAFSDALDLRGRWSSPWKADLFTCGPHGDEAQAAAVLSSAGRAAQRGDWQQVRALLESIPLDQVTPQWLPHHCHLLGLAWLRTGADAARSREIWQHGIRHDDAEDQLFRCKLDQCLELLEPLPDPLPDAWWGTGASLIRQLRGAIATADQRLAAGEPAAALTVMRRRVVTGTKELQSAARLAAAWLASHPDTPGGRFDKAIALARFTALAARGTLDLPVEGAWSQERLASLAGDAERWLAAWHEQQATLTGQDLPPHAAPP